VLNRSFRIGLFFSFSFFTRFFLTFFLIFFIHFFYEQVLLSRSFRNRRCHLICIFFFCILERAGAAKPLLPCRRRYLRRQFQAPIFFFIFFYHLHSCVWVCVFVCAAHNNQSLCGLKEKIIIMEKMQVNALRAPATHAAGEAVTISKMHVCSNNNI
jgi:hypothetical protein